MATLGTGQSGMTGIDRRKQLAAALTGQSMSSNRIVHPTQGWAKLAQALSGALVNRQVDKMEKAREEERRAQLAEALDPMHPTRIESRSTNVSVPGLPDIERQVDAQQGMDVVPGSRAEFDQQELVRAARAPATNIELEEIRESPKTLDEQLQALAVYDPNMAAKIAGEATLQQMLSERGLLPGETRTTNTKEWSIAAKQGYKGTLTDWIDRNEGKGQDGAPSGYRWNTKGALEFIEGGPADPAQVARLQSNTPEQAAKVALLRGAIRSSVDFRKALLETDKDGNVKVKTSTILAMNFPGGGAPFSEGRTANVLIKESIEAKLRAESGAAVPTTEVERAAERFRPSVMDSDETVILKIELLDRFLQDAYTISNKNGKFDVSRTIDNLIDEADKVLGPATPQQSYKVGDTVPGANGQVAELTIGPDGQYKWIIR